MRPSRRGRLTDTGVILLAYEIFHLGLAHVPPVTFFSIAGQVGLYLGLVHIPWTKEEVCISSNAFFATRSWKRFIISTLEHGDDMHLYYNMASFLIKGKTLEQKYQPFNFALLLPTLLFITNTYYILLGYTLTKLTGDASHARACAIGFSGVIFALKVLTTFEDPDERATIHGVTMPGKYAAWVELILIHMLVPNSSFIGHLSGILAGLTYSRTIIGGFIDSSITFVTGYPFIHGNDTNEETVKEREKSVHFGEGEEDYEEPSSWQESYFYDSYFTGL